MDYRKLLEPYKPSVYEGVKEYEEVIWAEGEMLELAHRALQNLQASSRLSTLPVEYVSSYEKIFGIIPNTSTETLEFRRQRIINRLSTKPPFSMGFLRQKLDEIVGVGRWVATVDNENYTLYVESSAVDQQWAGELSITIHSIKPANIVYVPVPAVFGRIFVNSSSRYDQNTANYVAGRWIVGEKDIVSYSDRGELLMANVMTMKDAMMENLLQVTKEYIIGDFRLNGTLSKPATVEVNSTNNELIVTCEVLESDGLINITQVEILDKLGVVIDSYPTFVPIIDGVTLKYSLRFGEGVR